MSNTDLLSSVQYTPYQKEFVTRLVAEVQPGSVHRLVAPVGSGKSFAIAGAVAELVRCRHLERVLVLVPPAIRDQWSYLLNRWDLDSVVIDGRTQRVLQQEFNAANEWPAGVYIMSIDLAKKPDVRSVLCGARWGLLVTDEAYTISGQRRQLIEKLVQSTPAPAIIMATISISEEVPTSIGREIAIDWRDLVADFRRESEEGVGSLISREVRKYRRSIAEQAVERKVVETARLLGPLKGMVLIRRACSSMNSLEESLVRWVESTDPEIDHRDELETLLVEVEHLGCDSRLDCFNGLVERLVASGVKQVVVMCEDRSTIDYLSAAFERSDFPDFSLHGGVSHDQRRKIVEQFEAHGGLLVTTGAGSEGVSLNFVVTGHSEPLFHPA